MVQVHFLVDVIRGLLQQDRPQGVRLGGRHGLDEGLQVLLQLLLRQGLTPVGVQGVEDRADALLRVALEEDREPTCPLAKAQGAVAIKVHGVEDLVQLLPVLRCVRHVLGDHEVHARLGKLLARELRLEPAPGLVAYELQAVLNGYGVQRGPPRQVTLPAQVVLDQLPCVPRLDTVEVDERLRARLEAQRPCAAARVQGVPDH
mmetsp:Transcript_76797/g.225461  ORF Transcript_76797/g.225461 Transcript_76797/m.225461 type:complete len:203 (-) Transcript_76797:36-644(-)